MLSFSSVPWMFSLPLFGCYKIKPNQNGNRKTKWNDTKKKNNNNLAPLVYQAEDESCIYTEVKVGAEGAKRAY